MHIDIHFFIILTGIIFSIELLVLSLQYLVLTTSAKSCFGWWLLGNVFNLVGLAFNFLCDFDRINPFAIIANSTFFISGITMIYIGVSKFFKVYKLKLWHIFYILCSTLISIYFTYINPNLLIQRMNLALGISIMAFLIARLMYINKKKSLTTIHFISIVFMAYSFFFLIKAMSVFNFDEGIFTPSLTQISTYIFMIIASILYTFGFIILINKKLNKKDLEEKIYLDLIFNTSPDSIIVTDFFTGEIIKVNKGFEEETGYDSLEINGNSTLAINIWKYEKERETFKNILLENGQCKDEEFTFCKKGGQEFIGSVSAKLVRIENIYQIIAVTRNITDRKIIEDKLKANEKFLADIIENNGALIYVKDKEGEYKLVNKKWEEVTTKTRENVIGHKDIEIFPGKIGTDFNKMDTEVMKAGIIQEKEEVLENEFGKRTFISIKFPTFNKNNEITGICGISTEITQRKKKDEQIQQLVKQLEIEKSYAQKNAITDGLTNIFNRRYFDEIMKKEFYRFKRSNLTLSLIMLDIDFFKKYNDSYGHLAGDECLRQVAKAIKSVVMRATDTVARYGGEEFSIILPDTSKEDAIKIAENIRNTIENLNLPHISSNISKYVTASLGVATLYRLEAQTPEEIVKTADDALYLAKTEGRNRVRAQDNFIYERCFLPLIWREADECGNEIIDEAHRNLLAVSNKIMIAVNTGEKKEKCIKLTEELLEEIIMHCKNEEEIISEISYPQVEKHKLSHIELIDKANRTLEKYKEDKIKIDEFISFITYDVIAKHLAIEDKEFFPYFKN